MACENFNKRFEIFVSDLGYSIQRGKLASAQGDDLLKFENKSY